MGRRPPASVGGADLRLKFMPTIALVDDDRNILTSVSIALEGEGYRVQTYTDGAQALDGEPGMSAPSAWEMGAKRAQNACQRCVQSPYRSCQYTQPWSALICADLP